MRNQLGLSIKTLIAFVIGLASNVASAQAPKPPAVILCPLEKGGVQVSTPQKNSEIFQKCLSSAGAGDIIELLPGEYPLQTAIVISKAIQLRTRGLSPNHKCGRDESFKCAHIKAVSPVANIQRAFIQVQSANVTFARIVIDGDKENRTRSIEANKCLRDNGMGMNLHVNAPNFEFNGSSTIDALCGTGIEVTAAGVNLKILNSYAGSNGFHDRDRLWADGITVHQSHNAVVKDNVLVDNTDIDLIFGGCTNCQIVNNEITHSDDFSKSAFAALMIHAWPNSTNGDYTGSEISSNRIDCGNKQCGIGLLIGSNPWYNAPMFGGVFRNNVIQGAQGGLIINDATGKITLGINTVLNSGGVSDTSSGRKTLPAYGISRLSSDNVQFIEGGDRKFWQRTDLSGAIPNWWK